MKRNSLIAIILLVLTSVGIACKAQYLVRLSFENTSSKIGYGTEIVFFQTEINFIDVERMVHECEKSKSILLNFGIPIIDSGFIPPEYNYSCGRLDTISINFDNIFSPDTCFLMISKSDNCIYTLEYVKFDGEICVFKPWVQIWGEAPSFNCVAIIVKINKISQLEDNEKNILQGIN